MLVSIYHMTLKILENCIFGVKTSRFPLSYATLYWTSLCFPKICKPLVSSGLSILLHGFISLPDPTSCDKYDIWMHLLLFADYGMNRFCLSSGAVDSYWQKYDFEACKKLNWWLSL